MIDDTTERNQEHKEKGIIMTTMYNRFFHSRTQRHGRVFVLCGRLRIAYAILLLLDRYILYYDFHHWFGSTTMLPCQQFLIESTTTKMMISGSTSLMCTIAGMVDPTLSPHVYAAFFYVGMVNAVLLLLGIAPKLQLLLLHVNMLSFHYHNNAIWDGEDVMFKIWNFLFLFLPLHHVTIYDNFRHLFPDLRNATIGTTTTTTTTVATEHDDTQQQHHVVADETTTTTWPMWPFRLWQIEMCCIYMGAGYSKLSTDIWYRGNALRHIVHMNDFFGGPITPDFIFNRCGPLHIMTWSSLLVECSCIIFIWPLRTRKAMLIAIVLLHLGIEFAMNMHCFEWLTMIGWSFFLVQRQEEQEGDKVHDCMNATTSKAAAGVNETKGTGGQGPTNSTTTSTAGTPNRTVRKYINLFLIILISTFVYDTIPIREIANFFPVTTPFNSENLSWSERIVWTLFKIQYFRTNVARPYYYESFVQSIGLYQGVWDLFTGSQDLNNRVETIIKYRNDTVASHISPDWRNITWYEKKRWQRVMTFYDNFPDTCKDCYASYHAELYGPKNVIRSVRLMFHTEQPPAGSTGNIFDMDYFFKPAKETLVSNSPKEMFLLNYCDDDEDECEEFLKLGYCTSSHSDNDIALFEMTKKCRSSCGLCDVDTEALEIGQRVSVYYTKDAQYYDGTIIDTKLLHTVRHYLIRDDEFAEEPEWTTSITLRKLGVRLLTNNTEKGKDDATATKKFITPINIPSSESPSLSEKSLVNGFEDSTDDRNQLETSSTGTESSTDEL